MPRNSICYGMITFVQYVPSVIAISCSNSISSSSALMYGHAGTPDAWPSLSLNGVTHLPKINLHVQLGTLLPLHFYIILYRLLISASMNTSSSLPTIVFTHPIRGAMLHHFWGARVNEIHTEPLSKRGLLMTGRSVISVRPRVR